MKILAVITGMKSGGAERVMSLLCNYLSKTNDVRLAVLKSRDSDYYISLDVDVVAGNIKNKDMFKSIFFVKKQIECWHPDVVLSFMTKSNIVSIIAKDFSKHKCPVVIAERANPNMTGRILSLIRKLIYKRADGCVFQTKWQQDYYKNFQIKNGTILLNPLSPDFSIIPYKGKRKKKIVCTARLYPEKNQQLLIRAFYKLNKMYPEYSLEIYGEGPDRFKIQNLIYDLKLNDSVKLMGRKNNIQKYIRDAAIFVLPSNSEGMPNSLLEAVALGIPSIATDCPMGGSSIIIKNEINGILVPMDDVDALSNAIERLIVDRELSDKISDNGIKIVEEFNSEKICKKWENYLLKIKNGG